MNKIQITICTAIYLSVCSIFLASTSSVLAGDCTKALKMDSVNLQRDVKSTFHFLNIINQSNYSEAKKSLKTGLTIPIEGVPVSGDADYGSMSKAKSSYFKKTKFVATRDESLAYASSILGDNAVRAYIACLNQRKRGLLVNIVSATDDTVKVRFEWVKPSGNSNDPVTFNVGRQAGISSGGDEVPTVFTSGQVITRTFNRNQSSDFEIRLDSSFGYDSVSVHLGKPYKKPENQLWFKARAWAGADDFENAPNKYVADRLYVVEKPKQGEDEKSELVLHGNQGAELWMSFFVNSKGRYGTRIDWRRSKNGAAFDSTKYRSLGRSKASMLMLGDLFAVSVEVVN